MFDVRTDDLSSEESRSLLAFHLAGMHASSPSGSVFALDLTALKTPDIIVFSAWSDNKIASIGALKLLDPMRAEVKSMRTHPNFLRMGAGAAILKRIVGEARSRRIHYLSLETGSGDAFHPALQLYRSHGFVQGNAFANYEKSEFNQFLHLAL